MIYFEGGYDGEEFSANHPRVLWNSVSRRGTVTVSSEADGYDGTNAATATTADRWKPTSLVATWDLVFDDFEDVNAVAIASHTIGSNDCGVRIDQWDGADWVAIMTVKFPEDDGPVVFLFEELNLDRIRVRISGSDAPEIGVIHVSKAIELPQKVYMGAQTPVDLALVTKFENNRTSNGQYLGRSIVSAKNENTFTVEHLTETWVRDNLFPFIKDAREYPYFLLERPEDYPDAVSYRWRDDDITPQRMGMKSYMQVDL